MGKRINRTQEKRGARVKNSGLLAADLATKTYGRELKAVSEASRKAYDEKILLFREHVFPESTVATN
jgi:hypothetical protein